MKKFISVLLCFALLFSCGIFAVAEDAPSTTEPTVRVTYSLRDKILTPGQPRYNAYILIEILNCPGFSFCDISFKFPDARFFVNSSYTRTNELRDGLKNASNCKLTTSAKKTETGTKLSIQLERSTEIDTPAFAQAVLTPISQQYLFSPVIENIELQTFDGEIENANIEIIDNTEQTPELYMWTYTGYTYAQANPDFSADPDLFIGCEIFCRFCPNLESFEIEITYNSDVLQFHTYPFGIDAYIKNKINCVVTEPGKATITGSNTMDGVDTFDPFCLRVIGEGDTNITIESVTWKTTDGENTDVNFISRILNFTTVPYSTIKPLTGIPSAVTEGRVSSIWIIEENMTVAEFAKTAPNDIFEIYAPNGEKLKNDDIIGTGCVYKLNCYDQCFISKSFVIQNDLSGDGFVTAEDARQALRFAVGLDTATEAQCHAAGVSTTKNFTSDIARSILRCSIGLEP